MDIGIGDAMDTDGDIDLDTDCRYDGRIDNDDDGDDDDDENDDEVDVDMDVDVDVNVDEPFEFMVCLTSLTNDGLLLSNKSKISSLPLILLELFRFTCCALRFPERFKDCTVCCISECDRNTATDFGSMSRVCARCCALLMLTRAPAVLCRVFRIVMEGLRSIFAACERLLSSFIASNLERNPRLRAASALRL